MFSIKIIAIVVILVPCIQCQPTFVQIVRQQQQQPQGYLPERKVHVVYNNDIIKDFEYVPTVQGYRYSYVLYDGSARTENVFIKGTPNSLESGLDSKNTDLNAIGIGGRRRMPTKNRKLAPGSLKSLAG
ncbi:uncharacterized protein LOC142233922 [Haematobia irritans]|uniref:uncharacterized protein LOC142233922 n=1 Tax=Haematobia irritans TaxID=7368 RepID=UPI003F4F82BA